MQKPARTTPASATATPPASATAQKRHQKPPEQPPASATVQNVFYIII